MERLNYQHLYYFWTVAREGSVTRACESLRLAQPTVSGQLAVFERSVGEPLFQKVGRRLALTETGKEVFNYADEIFTLGRELSDSLRGRPGARALRLSVGVADALPKLIVHRLLAPALRLPQPPRLVCYEGKSEQLVAELGLRSLDLVLSDAPATPTMGARVFNRLLSEDPIAVFGTAPLAARYAENFPHSLAGAPLLLPTANNALRRALNQWLNDLGINPEVRAEIEDSALLKTIAASGAGLVFAPACVREELAHQYGLSFIGEIDAVHERVYAVTLGQMIRHAAVSAIVESAGRGS